jgi:rare lipoprotein A
MPTTKTDIESIFRTAGLILLCLSLLLVSCTGKRQTTNRYSQAQDSAPEQHVDVSQVKDAVPKPEPFSRYGNPDSYVVNGKRYHTLDNNKGYRERGIASWYGTKFHGHRTSSGETYDMYQMSAAHKSLPLPTYARVTNLHNSKSVIVKINDRGPFHDNRLIDLSYAAAARLGILGKGTGLVEVTAIDPANHQQAPLKTRIAASQPKLAGKPAQPSHEPSLYLQLGAFLSRSNAERLESRLSGINLPGKLLISESKDRQRQPIYRVRIGPLANVKSADRLTQLLAGYGIESPRVVID